MPQLAAGAHVASDRHRGRILASLLALALAAAGLAAAIHFGAPLAHADAGSNMLGPGEVLGPGQSLRSNDGRFTLDMQDDGNLVLYGPGRQVLFASNRDGRPLPGSSLQNTGDGNIYVVTPGGLVVFPIAFGRTVAPPGTVLTLQDDGNLVAYAPGGRPVFATNTVFTPPPPTSVQPPSDGGSPEGDGTSPSPPADPPPSGGGPPVVDDPGGPCCDPGGWV